MCVGDSKELGQIRSPLCGIGTSVTTCNSISECWSKSQLFCFRFSFLTLTSQLIWILLSQIHFALFSAKLLITPGQVHPCAGLLTPLHLRLPQCSRWEDPLLVPFRFLRWSPSWWLTSQTRQPRFVMPTSQLQQAGASRGAGWLVRFKF